MTLKEARRRTGFYLRSDAELPYYDQRTGSGTAREGQEAMERKYPRHRIIRRAALRFFSSLNVEIYPRGATVDGTGTCPDFFIMRGNELIFIECLTEHKVEADYIKKKRQVERFAPIHFVVEAKPTNEFNSKKDILGYLNRVRRLARVCKVYWCNPLNKKIWRVRIQRT